MIAEYLPLLPLKSIVIIDDDAVVLSTYQMALEDKGYMVFTASSGDEGLQLARQKLPDLILADVHMPGTDGRSVLRAIREDPNLGGKQVVLMTGNPRQATPRAGMELGADDFLIKPFDLESLSRCVSARLDRAQVHWRVEDRMIKGLRTSLHHVLPHEFFTPLTGVVGLVDILKDDFQRMEPAEVRTLLSEVEKCAWRLQRTLRNYLRLIDPPQPETHISDAMTPAAVREIIENAATLAGRRNERMGDLRLKLKPVALHVVAADLAIIVEELVNNACGFSRHGTEVKVELDEAGVLSVEDRGRGMTGGQISQVGAFRQFDRNKFEQQGLGVGLALVQRLVESAGAHFALTSRPGQGTSARVEFKVATD